MLFSKTNSGLIEYGSKSESSKEESKDTKNSLRLLQSSFWLSDRLKSLSIEYVCDVY